MALEEKVLCKNCKCWDSNANGSGMCRRHAPAPTVMKGDDKDKYILIVPSTPPNDGCWDGIPA
jgi:hypothetical protein